MKIPENHVISVRYMLENHPIIFIVKKLIVNPEIFST